MLRNGKFLSMIKLVFRERIIRNRKDYFDLNRVVLGELLEKLL